MKKLILAAFSILMLGVVNVKAQTLDEGFDVFGSFPPNDWTIYDYSGSHVWIQSGGDSYNGAYSARLSGNGSTNDDWLITPKLEISSATDSISFFGRLTSATSTHSLNVKVSTTGKDTASFTTTLANITPGTTWTEFAYSLSAYNGQDIYVALQSNSSGYGNFYIDSVTGPTLFVPTCQTVAYVNTDNITHNSVELTWDSISNAVSYTYEVFAEGTGPAGTVLVTGSTTDTNIVVNGLPMGTDLEVWVTTDCGATDGLSEVDGPFEFSTICGPVEDEYLEDFTIYTNSNGSWLTLVSPNCWTEAKGELELNTTFSSTSNTNDWLGGDYANVSGASRAARLNLYTTNQFEWLISPTINLDSIPNATLSFFAAFTNYNSPDPGTIGDDDKVHLVISTDDGTTWADTNIILTYDTSNVPSHTGSYVSIPLDDYSGEVKFGFYGESTVNTGSVNDNDFFIEDFRIGEAPTCDIIAQITADSLDPYNAYISWDTTTFATSFLVEYGTPGFTLGTGTQLTVTSGGVDTVLQNLTANTEYEVYVAPICSATDTGDFQVSLIFTTECAPLTAYFTEDFTSYLPNDCWSEADGDLVASTTLTNFNSFNWEQGGFLNVGSTGAAKIYISSWSFSSRNDWLITESIDLDSITYAQIEFDAGITTAWGSGSASMGSDDRIVILISTDDGATWEESNTIFTFTEAGNSPSNTGTHYAFPVTTYSGVVKFAFYVESTVGNNAYDFFVDNFQVSEAPTCLPTMTYTVVSVEDTTATISWDNVNSVNDYIVEYGEQGFTLGTGTTQTVTTGNSVTLTGLDPVTTYDFYVRAICSPTDTANFLLNTTFTTECLTLSETVLEVFNDVAPECWSEAEGELTASATLTGTSSAWAEDGFLNNGVTGSARLRIADTDEYHWLITPTIYLGTQEKQIEFDAGQTAVFGTASANFASDDRLAVVVSLDDGATWSEDNIILEFNQGQPLLNAGGHYTASLEDFAGSGNIKIGFYGQSEITNLQLNAYIDNFELKDLDTTAVDLGVVSIEVPDTFCTGESVQLSALVENSGFVPVGVYSLTTNITGPTPYNNTTPFFANIQVDAIDTADIIDLSGLQPGMYQVEVTVNATGDINAMNNKIIKSFYVSDYPSVFAGSDITICYGESYTFNATGANSYTWSGGFNNGDSVTPTTTTSYIVGGANEAGCISYDTVVVDVEINAPPTIIYVNQLLLTDELYLNYYWQFNGNTVGTNSTYAVTQNGIYTLVAITFSGCEVIQTYNVMGIGVDEVNDLGVSVHPNPVKDILNVTTDKEIENIKVFDLNGRKVIDNGLSEESTVNVSALEDGIYILYGTIDGQPFQTKFTKL